MSAPTDFTDEIGVPAGTTTACVIHLQGGASTYVELSVGEVEDAVADARRERTGLIYLQPRNLGPNSVVIDPNAVVAIFGARCSR